MNWRFWSRTGGAGCDSCTAIEPLLSLYSDGMAAPSEVRRVEAHLADCDGCRQSLGWMRATRQVIAARPAVPPPVDLRARIARAIAEADGVAPAPVRVRRPPILRPALAYGLSFALLAALSGSLFWNADHQPLTTVAHVHPTQLPVAVATNPGDTLPQLRPGVHLQARPTPAPVVATVPNEPGGPDVINSTVPVPHIPRVPTVRTHRYNIDDWLKDVIPPANANNVKPIEHDLAPKTHPFGKATVTPAVHHAGPQGNTPTTFNEHLAVKPKPDTTAPPKRSPLTPPPVEVATAHVPADVTPETPRINILPATVTPEPRVEVHEASLTDTLRESVRQMHEHMHDPLQPSRAFKLSSSVVEAAGVSSDRSGTLAAVASGFGGR